jgi:two-component system response regulator NreC
MFLRVKVPPAQVSQLALEKVYRGEKYIPLAERFVSNPKRAQGIHQLTGREREVLKLLAEGNSVKDSAILMDLSTKTVEVHKFNLMRKLNIHNKVQLVVYAVSHKVLTVQPVL